MCYDNWMLVVGFDVTDPVDKKVEENRYYETSFSYGKSERYESWNELKPKYNKKLREISPHLKLCWFPTDRMETEAYIATLLVDFEPMSHDYIVALLNHVKDTDMENKIRSMFGCNARLEFRLMNFWSDLYLHQRRPDFIQTSSSSSQPQPK